MGVMQMLSGHVKVFLTALALVAMCIGIAGIWGYVGPDAVGKAIGTMALIGGTVFVIDGVIYGKHITEPAKPAPVDNNHVTPNNMGPSD